MCTWRPWWPVSGSQTGQAGLVTYESIAVVAIRTAAESRQAASARRAPCSRRGEPKQNSSGGAACPASASTEASSA